MLTKNILNLVINTEELKKTLKLMQIFPIHEVNIFCLIYD